MLSGNDILVARGMDTAVERCVSFESPALEALPGYDVIRNVSSSESDDSSSTFVDQRDTDTSSSISVSTTCIYRTYVHVYFKTNHSERLYHTRHFQTRSTKLATHIASMDLDLDPPVIVIQEPLEKQSMQLTSARCLTSEGELTAADDETSSIGSVYSPTRTYHNLR